MLWPRFLSSARGNFANTITSAFGALCHHYPKQDCSSVGSAQAKIVFGRTRVFIEFGCEILGDDHFVDLVQYNPRAIGFGHLAGV